MTNAHPTASRFQLDPALAWATFAGAAAIIVGIGLQRFAYTPLIPALISGKWFLPAEAAYLGAANFAGYLAGALSGRPVAARFGAVRMLRFCMAFSVVIFAASSEPLSFYWFFGWRFLSGLSGGVIMVLAAPTILAEVPPSRRGLVSGLMFGGVGLGIVASGTIIPLMIKLGLSETWYGLAAASLVLAALAWPGWPNKASLPRTAAVTTSGKGEAATSRPLLALYSSYALNALGLVPHMVFLVDFVARGLYQGLNAGAAYWVLFGVGAMIGPVATGALGDAIGFRHAQRLGYLLQALAVGVLTFAGGSILLGFSSLVIGAFVPGVVPLNLGRVQELLPDDPVAQGRAWTFCTAAFAVGQMAGAYVFSFIFSIDFGFAEARDSYGLLFGLGALSMLMAMAVDFAGNRRPESRTEV